MMGPLGMIFKTLAKTGGKAVQKDIRATDGILAKQHFAKFKNDFASYHEKKISDLAGDSGVSGSWLQDLIHESKSVDHLNRVLGYVNNAGKTANLTPGAKREIVRETMQKIEALRDKELLMKMAAFIKNHGEDFL